MTRFYVTAAKQRCRDDGQMSAVWDSRTDVAEGKRYPCSPRRALMNWLNEFERGRVISIYEIYVDDDGTKEIVAWIEVDVPETGKRT